MNHSKNRIIWKIVRGIAIILCLLSIIYIGYVFCARYEEKQEYQALKEDVVTLEDVQNAEFTGEREGNAPKLPEEFANKDRTEIDFEKLQSYNPELVAWIQIADTNIDYPVARHEGEDQEYYLNYNMYQEPAFSGCIYMEDWNQADFSDNNTILYGHNMKNGSMFHDLHKFENADFFDKHTSIYVYIPGHRLVYDVFAAYSTDSVKISAAYDFSQNEEYERYLDSLHNIRSMDSLVRNDVAVTNTDRILTLSTCIGGEPNKRYLVQGVLVDDIETK